MYRRYCSSYPLNGMKILEHLPQFVNCFDEARPIIDAHKASGGSISEHLESRVLSMIIKEGIDVPNWKSRLEYIDQLSEAYVSSMKADPQIFLSEKKEPTLQNLLHVYGLAMESSQMIKLIEASMTCNPQPRPRRILVTLPLLIKAGGGRDIVRNFLRDNLRANDENSSAEGFCFYLDTCSSALAANVNSPEMRVYAARTLSNIRLSCGILPPFAEISVKRFFGVLGAKQSLVGVKQFNRHGQEDYGKCPCCGSDIRAASMKKSDGESKALQGMLETWIDGMANSKFAQEMAKISNWARNHGTFDTILDGANIGFAGEARAKGVRGGAKFNPQNIVSMFDQVVAMGRNPVVILNEMRRKQLGDATFEKLSSRKSLFFTPTEMNDDHHFLYMAFIFQNEFGKNDVQIVTNDFLRDHIKVTTAKRMFSLWAESHTTKFSKRDMRRKDQGNKRQRTEIHDFPQWNISFPPGLATRTILQEEEDKIALGAKFVAHFPVNSRSGGPQWLCCTEA